MKYLSNTLTASFSWLWYGIYFGNCFETNLHQFRTKPSPILAKINYKPWPAEALGNIHQSSKFSSLLPSSLTSDFQDTTTDTESVINFDYSSYTNAVTSFWSSKLGSQYATSTNLKKLINDTHLVIIDPFHPKFDPADPLLNITVLKLAFDNLDEILPKNCNTARIVLQYPPILREIANCLTSKFRSRKEQVVKIKARIQSLEQLLPGISGSFQSEENGYASLIERAPTRLFLNPKAEFTKGAVLDQKIDTMATLMFPTEGKLREERLLSLNYQGQRRRTDKMWEFCRAQAVMQAPYLLGYAQSRYSQLIKPRSTTCNLKEKAQELSSTMNITMTTAELILRRAPALAKMNLGKAIKKKSIEMAKLLQCDSKQFVTVVKRNPSLLTMKVETVLNKIEKMDSILNGYDNRNHEKKNITINQAYCTENLAPDTFAVVRRVPLLLTQDLEWSISVRAVSLQYLLFGANNEIDKGKKQKRNDAFRKVIRRCPELLLLDAEENVAPKLRELSNLLSLYDIDSTSSVLSNVCSKEAGAKLALREPRLLMYDIKNSLVPKAQMWMERVADPILFASTLASYPTLLMYSYGASARLEYFAYIRNGLKPNVSEARQLLMVSRKKIEFWGNKNDNIPQAKSIIPVLRSVGQSKGNERAMEVANSAFNLKQQMEPMGLRDTMLGTFRKKELVQFVALNEMKVDELRLLLRSLGGKPGTKRKNQLIQRILDQGYLDNLSSALSPYQEDVLSYRDWIAVHLCSPVFDGTVASFEDKNIVVEAFQKNRCTRLMSENLTVKELEKLYGTALRGIFKARQSFKKLKPNPFELGGRAGQLTFRSFVQDRASQDEDILKSFEQSNKGSTISSLLPNIDISTLVTEYPQLFIIDSKSIEMKIASLKVLFQDFDIGQIIIKCPQLLDPGVQFQETRQRISDLEELLYPMTRKQVLAMLSKQPQVLMPVGTNTRYLMKSKIKFMQKAVGQSQKRDLSKLLLKYPRVILCEPSALCRITFLKDYDGSPEDQAMTLSTPRGTNSVWVRNPVVNLPKIDLERRNCFLPVGELSAVVRRDCASMVSRHPYYADFIQDSLGKRSGRANTLDLKIIEDGEDKVGELLMKRFIASDSLD